MQVLPIGNFLMPQGEWTVDNSWTAPAPATGTLAELIQDLSQELDTPAAVPIQPAVDISAQPTVEPVAELILPAEPPPQIEPSTSAKPSTVSETQAPIKTPLTETIPAETLPTETGETAVPDEGLEIDEMAALDRLLAPPEATKASESAWFLGIDIGTTGISAVLLNQAQAQLYPLYWQSIDSAGATVKKFRLPTVLTVMPSNPAAVSLPTIRLNPASAEQQLHLSNWKPYLRVAVPHYSPQTSQWEPVLQGSHETLPLRTIQEGLQQLLTSLNTERAAFMPSLLSGALALETEQFQAILANLAGVIVGYPSNWSDTYSLNVSEAILQAGLVKHPSQVVFIEEAIATLLSALPATDGRSVSLPHQPGSREQLQGHLHNAHWQGKTLIFTAGASLTELVLVDLPQPLAKLNHTDFYVRSLPYAGEGIDQDIISQLLYPALVQLDAVPNAQMAIDMALEPINLESLGLDFPAVAELDLAKRHQLQQSLTYSDAGQQLLRVARSLKLGLQSQHRFVLKYGTQTLTFERPDLTSQVLLPYVQRLNRELNTLLAQTNTTSAAVKQVICTGGTASLSAIARWLRQKLPNATLIQDTYSGSSVIDNCIASCSRVAYGLATVPLHNQVIDQARHQYSDYFLLLELLRALPQRPLAIETIMQLLETRGIDTQVCRFRILALLEGSLPSGLIPAESDSILFTAESAANPDYRAIRLAPLFMKQSDRTYEPNRPAWEYLQQYLATLLADTEQTLSQPLTLEPFLRPSPQ